ncbi:cold-shock protein [Carboxylicivirga marina]|uniref:Cold shock domain-containing protein n=1 Tax=Carboxylicivirga marina TaxID=2800988 RepID=A0ABS1HG49_9BACT|nr:cold shock domain-containing protein [Carboxylicivirga marina]MBK3516632.1 cold shock domain-containing protein [Carboxylicivirga marina]
MAKSQQTFGKKEKEKKRLQKRKEKQQKLEERKANPKSSSLDDMIAYVDEFGNISTTPPDPTKKREKIDAESIEISIPKKEDVEEDPIKKGRVDFFDSSKGFGFIIEQDTKERFFVHVNGLLEEIVEGNLVSFELEQGLKGLNAVRVKKI